MRDRAKPTTLRVWTELDIRRVGKMLKQGMSAAEIGTEIGATRNAIIGKVRRDPYLNAIGFTRPASGRSGGRPKGSRTKERPTVAPVKIDQNDLTPFPKKPAIRIVSNNVDLLVKDWMEKHGGARRFQRGTSSEFWRISEYLKDRGYYLGGTPQKSMVTLRVGTGRPMKKTWREILDLADKLRMKEGLEPIVYREQA